MRFVFALSLLSLPVALPARAQVPQMNTVQPESGKIGSVLRIHGVYLGKEKVDEVYLTDHTFDMMVKVLDQTEDSIEFRIPPSAKPGRLQLLVKTPGKKPLLLEQPVYITVEEKDPSVEVAASSH
ncbi:MAG TPA: hypothetical protein VLW25_08325 [Bryobacteraceae bacterium]|nr:hypothetical protein [Bryobacteraceae bacterium]